MTGPKVSTEPDPTVLDEAALLRDGETRVWFPGQGMAHLLIVVDTGQGDPPRRLTPKELAKLQLARPERP